MSRNHLFGLVISLNAAALVTACTGADDQPTDASSDDDAGPAIIEFSDATSGAPVTSLDLGVGALGAPRVASRAITLTNTGDSPVDLALTLDAASFTISSTDCATLTPDASCTATIAFAPIGPGLAMTSLVVNADTAPLPVHAEALGVTLDLLPLAGYINAPAEAHFVHVHNVASHPLQLMLDVTGDGFDVNLGSCGASIAADTECGFFVWFDPTTVGEYAGTVTVTTTWTDLDLHGSQAFPLRATATAVPFVVTPQAPGDEDIIIDEFSSATRAVHVRNTSGAPLTLAFDLSYDEALYTIANGCDAGPLAPGAACLVNVTFYGEAVDQDEGGMDLSIDVWVDGDPAGYAETVTFYGSVINSD